jgi:hypothetical protein
VGLIAACLIVLLPAKPEAARSMLLRPTVKERLRKGTALFDNSSDYHDQSIVDGSRRLEPSTVD